MSPNRCTSKPVTHSQAIPPIAAPTTSGALHAQTATAPATTANATGQGSPPRTTATAKTQALPPASGHAQDSGRVMVASSNATMDRQPTGPLWGHVGVNARFGRVNWSLTPS